MDFENCFVIVLSAVAYKCLFFFSYHSTDFEVHRNWLAVTHNRPISEWYTEKTSQWTLDYPPLFAMYEWTLSYFAQHIDPSMLIISKGAYISDKLIIFQRSTVIISELVLMYSINRLLNVIIPPIRKENNPWKTICVTFYAFNFGLIIIDHIHFQYNGLLYGILFLSISYIFTADYIKSGLLFAILLNMKHIFVYIAPVYFVFILLHYCFESTDDRTYNCRFNRLCSISFIVIAVFTISFGPFIWTGTVSNVIQRLFPFHRGVCHAYWAPNFWALYNAIEKSASISTWTNKYCKTINTNTADNLTNMTSGLTGEYMYSCLPAIKPIHTAVLTAIFMVPSILICKRSKDETNIDAGFVFVRAIVAAAWSSFLFGWHVHEKAILMVTLPLIFLAISSRCLRGLAFYVTTLAHFSLLPLIYTPPEQPAVLSLFLLFTVGQYTFLGRMSPPTYSGYLAKCWPLLSVLACFHLIGIIPIMVLVRLILPIYYPKYQFLPLMIMSIYTALGLISSFFVYLWVNANWILKENYPVVDYSEPVDKLVLAREKKTN